MTKKRKVGGGRKKGMGYIYKPGLLLINSGPAGEDTPDAVRAICKDRDRL